MGLVAMDPTDLFKPSDEISRLFEKPFWRSSTKKMIYWRRFDNLYRHGGNHRPCAGA